MTLLITTHEPPSKDSVEFVHGSTRFSFRGFHRVSCGSWGCDRVFMVVVGGFRVAGFWVLGFGVCGCKSGAAARKLREGVAPILWHFRALWGCFGVPEP